MCPTLLFLSQFQSLGHKDSFRDRVLENWSKDPKHVSSPPDTSPQPGETQSLREEIYLKNFRGPVIYRL